MKNTMKIKSLLSFFVPAAMMSLAVAGCSDYDNGYDSNAIKFNEEFRKAYGDIDPEQDWNLAERGTVTVSTMKESEVKIYALRGNEYVLVGDYEGVKGTRMLGFDMLEGTTNIIVSDGVTAEQTVPGGTVVWGDTRTTNTGTHDGVTISLITNDSGEPIVRNGVTTTYPKYKEADQATYEAMYSVVPEIGSRDNSKTNLRHVTSNFSYVSTGDFIIYPFYWNTSSRNTIGVYYTDANGVYHEVDIYTMKEGSEVQYYANGQWNDYKIPNGEPDTETWGSCQKIFSDLHGTKVHGQGIRVSIPKNTPFGMYLKKTDSQFGNCKFYSESSKNAGQNYYGPGIEDNGNSVNWNAGGTPSYASTFTVPGKDELYLGFEDWPNGNNMSDFDLNDMVVAFDGCKPIIINEDPEPHTWLVVCEDLGGSFDTDYNDVIFKVEHVSGETTAKVIPMAAGGMLASYIFFRDNTVSNANDIIVGEIHQMFGMAPEESGKYAVINAVSRYEKEGTEVTIPVSENWSMAYSTETTSQEANMGGFQIRTLKSGTPAPSVSAQPTDDVFISSATASVIAAPNKGKAPYMLCLPYTYTKDEDGVRSTYVWAWPVEMGTICSATYSNGQYKGSNGGAYLDFGAWVSSYNTKQDWYKNPNPQGVTVEELKLSSQSINHTKNPSPLALNNNATFVVMHDTSINFADYFTTTSTGSLSYTVTDLSGTMSTTITNSSFTLGTASAAITVNQAEDANYEAGSVTFVVSVIKGYYKYTPVNNSNLALSYASGNYNLQLKNKADNDNNQVWRVEDAGNGQVFLYNMGAGEYVCRVHSNSWDATFSATRPTNREGRYTISDVGNGVRISVEVTGTDRAFKAENLSDGSKVYMNGQNNERVVWNAQEVSVKQKQTLNLGNNGSITVKPGTEVNLFANLTNNVEGTYTFTYSGEMGSGTITNPDSWAPYNEGRRTITVTREADDTYEKATTSFTFIVTSSNNNDWTTLTNLGSAGDQQGSTSYTIAELLTVCGSASGIDIKVEGDNWGTITLIPMTNDNIAWGNELKSSSTTITVSKSQLQSWQNNGYNKVLMQNPSSSVQAKPAQ